MRATFDGVYPDNPTCTWWGSLERERCCDLHVKKKKMSVVDLHVRSGWSGLARFAVKYCSAGFFWTNQAPKSSVHVFLSLQGNSDRPLCLQEVGLWICLNHLRWSGESLKYYSTMSSLVSSSSGPKMEAGLTWATASALTVPQRPGTEFVCTFHMQETLLTSRSIIMRLSLPPQRLTLLSVHSCLLLKAVLSLLL